MNTLAFRLLFAFLVVVGFSALTARAVYADCTEGVCVRDDFLARILGGSSGSLPWDNSWVETNDTDGALGGNILIQTVGSPNYLEFNAGAAANNSWARCVGVVPTTAKNNTITLRAAIWSDITASPVDNDRITIEYRRANPTTSCGEEPGGTWSPLYSTNADQPGWTPIEALLPNSLRGDHFWIRLRMEGLLDSNEFHRFDYVEVGYISLLYVEFANVEAVNNGTSVAVNWQTLTELHNDGFNIWRATDPAGEQTRLNAQVIPSQADQPGHYDYTWTDTAELVPGMTYYYWIEAVGSDDATLRTGPVWAEFGLPTAVAVRASSAINNQSVAVIAAVLWLSAGFGLIQRRQRMAQ